MKTKLLSIFFFILFIISFLESYSVTYYSRVASGNWTDANSWSTSACNGAIAGTIPGAADDVIICVGNTIVMDGNPGACLSLTINGDANWTGVRTTNVGTGGITINVGGNISGSGNGTLSTTGGLIINATLTSTSVAITLQTTAGQIISGTGTLPRLVVNTTVTNAGTLTITTSFIGSGTLTQGASATLNYAGGGVVAPTIDASTNINTFNYSGTGTQTVKSTTYYNLTISNGGTSTLAGPVTITNNLLLSGGTLASGTHQIIGNGTGTLTISNGTVLTLGTTTSATVVDFPTNFITANISIGNTSRVTYQGNYAQSISTVPSSYGHITILTGASTVTKTLSSAANIVMAGSLTLTNGVGIVTFDLGLQSLTITGGIIGNGNLTMAGGNLTISGSFTNAGTFTPGSGLVTYGGGSQTIKGATYANLTTSGSGTKTLGGAITVNGNLTLNAGTFATSTHQVTGNAAGVFTMAASTALTIGNTGSVTNVLFPTNYINANIVLGANSTITYQGNSAQTISSVPTYRNLTVNTYTGSKAADGNITVLGNLITTTPAIIDMTTYTLDLTGSYTGTGGLSFTSGNFNVAGTVTNTGAFACGTGTVNYTSAGTQTVKGTTYYNLIISNAGTSTLGAATAVNNNLSITGGTFATSTFQITGNATGAFTLASGAAFTIGGTLVSSPSFPTLFTNISIDINSTVTYSSTGAQTIRATDYGTLVISGARTTANITLEAGTIGIMANTTTCFNPSATFTSGTVLSTGNTFEFKGTGAQTIRTFLYNNLTSSNTGARTLLSGGTISIAGVFTPGTNSYTVTGSTVAFNGNSAQTIPVFSYNHLTINTFSGLKPAAGSLTVAGNLVTTSPSTLDMLGYTLNLTGTYSGTGGLSFTNGNFNVAGSITNTGTFTCGTGTVTYTSGGSQTVKGTTYYNLIISNAGTSTLGGLTTVNNNLSVTGGTLATSTYQITGNASGTLSLASGTILDIGGSIASPTNFPSLFTNISLNSGSTVNYSSTGAQTIKAIDYGSLAISGARTTASVTLESGTIGITANTTTCFNPTANFTSGAYITTGNTIEFKGTGAQMIRAFTNGGYNNVTSSGVGTRTLQNGATIAIAGVFTPGTNVYTVTGSTVNFNGSVPQTVPLFTYNHLTLSGSGAKTLGGAVVTNGNLTITSNLDVTASNYALSVRGNWINNGTFTAQNGTVTLNGTVAQTMSGSSMTAFTNLTISNTAGVSITGGTYSLSDVLTLSNGTFASGGNSFTFLSTALKTARIAPVSGTGAFSGNFIIQRYIASRGTLTWANLSSPVVSTTVQDWDDELFFYYPHNPPAEISNVLIYDETISDYLGVNAATTITPGMGFEIYLTDDATLTGFSNTTINTIGTPNRGTQNLSLSYTAANAPYDGENLVGNPFASSIRVNALTFTNALNYVDVYDNVTDNYITLSGTDEIAPHQGFWAYATSNGASISVPEAAKTTSTTGTLKCAENMHFMQLTLASADGSHAMAHTLKIAADINAKDGWDLKDHPYRKSPNKKAPFITATAEKRQLSASTFSSNHTDYHMPLQSGVGIAGKYQISIKGIEIINETYPVVLLEDKKTGKWIDLNKIENYVFFAEPNDIQNRFVLHFSGGTQINNPISEISTIEEYVQILQTENGAQVHFNFQENQNILISVNNLLGQELLSPITTHTQSQSIQVSIPSDYHGIYMIRIITEKGEMVKKFVKP